MSPPAPEIALWHGPMIALRICSLVQAGNIDTIDPLDCDVSEGCGEREGISPVCAPWCVDGEDGLKLRSVSS